MKSFFYRTVLLNSSHRTLYSTVIALVKIIGNSPLSPTIRLGWGFLFVCLFCLFVFFESFSVFSPYLKKEACDHGVALSVLIRKHVSNIL